MAVGAQKVHKGSLNNLIAPSHCCSLSLSENRVALDRIIKDVNNSSFFLKNDISFLPGHLFRCVLSCRCAVCGADERPRA